MPTVVLSKVYWFTAAHRLNSEILNSAQNIDIYDKCNNYNGHGHDYRLEVSIKGYPDKKTGMILPIEEFDECVNKVLHNLDYKHLNQEVDYFKHNLSSGEIIIQYLWKKLRSALADNRLFHLKLWETNNNYFELGKG
jgi:6-pyruvoyltetrahydropterin/6-carboxytetrahydropterin synthase